MQLNIVKYIPFGESFLRGAKDIMCIILFYTFAYFRSIKICELIKTEFLTSIDFVTICFIKLRIQKEPIWRRETHSQ